MSSGPAPTRCSWPPGWRRGCGGDFRLGHVDAEKVTRVEVDGEVVPPARGLPSSPGDLLSAELESFGRDSVYEAAVRAV